MSTEMIERRFEVGSPAKLKLSNIRGLVDIQPGEVGVLAVRAVKHLDSGSQDLTEIEIEQAQDGQVIVKTKYEHSIVNWFGLNMPCKVDYTVWVPRNCSVRASGVSSEISIRNLEGSFEVNSVSGKVKLSNLIGSVKVGTVSGSVAAEKISGGLDANSVSGSVRVMEANLSEVQVKTVSGRMLLQTPLMAGPYRFKGVSGDVILIVPAETGCQASIQSISGRMRTSLPVTADHRYGSRGSMEIQGGGVEVSYNSVSGSLRVVTSEDEKAQERPVVPERPHPAQSQMAILSQIDRGEISVEEALRQLSD
jgi:Putative adhesin